MLSLAFASVGGLVVVAVIAIAMCTKTDEVKKSKAFQDDLEEISENVHFHVIAQSNKSGNPTSEVSVPEKSQKDEEYTESSSTSSEP